jgi:hypothetical protein
MFRMGKIQETKHFNIWSLFGHFWENSAKIVPLCSAAYMGRLHFYSAPFELCGRRIGQLVPLEDGRQSTKHMQGGLSYPVSSSGLLFRDGVPYWHGP